MSKLRCPACDKEVSVSPFKSWRLRDMTLSVTSAPNAKPSTTCTRVRERLLPFPQAK